ncbi:DEAD/DEAH box helicase family protein [Candidatus Saccharibacteria bacterium]|nr:DEAD/DEAH box helicase family protein [Candidatus Saccharibacteria bacterium]
MRNYPTGYFMGWFRSMVGSGDIQFNFYYKDEQYLVDAVSADAHTPKTLDEIRKESGGVLILRAAPEADKAEPDANCWEVSKPVIISAQTGKGKNYWVFNDLLLSLVNRYDSEDLILVLSNRIASCRQSKMQVAELLKNYIGDDKYSRHIEELYSSKGIDELCVDFGRITLCTYHQMLQRQILRTKKFKYIICDECHFFTSDATFNPYTNNMLKEIVTYGKDSVRVYMSATPEVAFEAIVREEYNLKLKQYWQEAKPLHDYNEAYRTAIESKRNDPMANMIAIQWVQTQHIPGRYTPEQWELGRQQFEEINSARNFLASGKDYHGEEVFERIISKHRLPIDFYYMPRRYDYIERICKYSTDEELFGYIKNSTEKWIVFVRSESAGKRLEKKLVELGIVPSSECVFISRPVVDLDGKEQEEYDFIIANETTNKRILITTCILDNGINIKNPESAKQRDKVLNVAISSYDRTQFIQMLGRVRDNQTDKINLYIEEFTVNKLKQIISRDAESLVNRLANDFRSLETKQASFNRREFCYATGDDLESFSQYNPCAIYQLIDQMTRTLRLIRKDDDNFFISVSDELTALKEQVYQFYLKNPKAPDSWRRSVVELLDTELHHKDVEQAIDDAIARGEDGSQYERKLDDTFTHYLFSELLAKKFLTIMEDKYNGYLAERLGTGNRNRYKAKMEQELRREIIASEFSTYNRAVLCYKQCELLKRMFRDKFGDIALDFFRGYVELIKHYDELADDARFNTFLEEQLRWIEKSIVDVCQDDSNTKSDVPVIEDSLAIFIRNHAITVEELEQSRRKKQDGSDSDYYDGDFLNEYGILKKDNRVNELSKTYCNGQSLTDCVGKQIIVGDATYKLQSANSNKSGHPTYYLFIKT